MTFELETFLNCVGYILTDIPEGFTREIKFREMAHTFEELMWDHIFENEQSAMGEMIQDGEPWLYFLSSCFGNLFYRLFAADESWRWGLVDMGFFNNMRVVEMQPYRVRFAPRLDDVQPGCFYTYGIALVYWELEELCMDTSTDSDM